MISLLIRLLMPDNHRDYNLLTVGTRTIAKPEVLFSLYLKNCPIGQHPASSIREADTDTNHLNLKTTFPTLKLKSEDLHAHSAQHSRHHAR
jgi:hypothetical protein